MTWYERVLTGSGLLVVGAPALVAAVMGLVLLLGYRLTERRITRLLEGATITGLAAAILILIGMLATGSRRVAITLGNWVVVPGEYHFAIKFVFDRLSVPFVILSFVLIGTIGAFASRYLHREEEFARFFMLYAIFLLGMVVASLAGTIETLFTGWELVGLSSALLVAYYQERPAPSRSGLWVWSVYRVSDAALLFAAVVLHHLMGEGDLSRLLGSGTWPYQHAEVASGQALLVGLLLIVAAAGKSALVPFSGWLPRAMEGPTPSSAIFYGALSVHLGAFLLLRLDPLIDRSIWLAGLLVVIGLATAVLAYLSSLVQTDIKSALCYASLTQVGIIVVEIGLGLRYVALVHMIGHATLRTLQFLRAPSILHEYHLVENALGEHRPVGKAPSWARLAGASVLGWLYRLALERSYLDGFLREVVVEPFRRGMLFCDRFERRWTDRLSGGESRESDHLRDPFGVIDELS